MNEKRITVTASFVACVAALCAGLKKYRLDYETDEMITVVKGMTEEHIKN